MDVITPKFPEVVIRRRSGELISTFIARTRRRLITVLMTSDKSKTAQEIRDLSYEYLRYAIDGETEEDKLKRIGEWVTIDES